ncbi:hypothetical protein M3N64_12590 [Sporolactobacillus sp. CPB3-1]|uniref:Uncharacterized protein n=1 Tax=Sporolactobacillus mangiferae TaxID=2940498 RepID=A0ABT0MDU6_9BACL|nr:hypothetical protein [Sporolactobacillus mangiferae]MCL1632758.1 hypothetical protein [Sporolactobacillus mangiferae]
MLTYSAVGLKEMTVAQLQDENRQLELQILALKNERARARARYEETIKKLQATREHLLQIERGVDHFPKDISK